MCNIFLWHFSSKWKVGGFCVKSPPSHSCSLPKQTWSQSNMDQHEEHGWMCSLMEKRTIQKLYLIQSQRKHSFAAVVSLWWCTIAMARSPSSICLLHGDCVAMVEDHEHHHHHHLHHLPSGTWMTFMWYGRGCSSGTHGCQTAILKFKL